MGNQKERRRRKMERKEINGVTIVMLSIREIVLSVHLFMMMGFSQEEFF